MSCREGLPGRTSCWFSMALPTIVAETSRFPPTSRCSSCHPTRQSSIQRKTSGMKSARNSSRTMPSSPSMPCAESSSRRSSISSAIPKPLNPSPRSPTSSGHSDVEVVLGAMFGSYPNDSGLDVDYTAAFRNGLYSQDVPVDPADGLPFVLLHGCSPIQLTMHKLRYEGPRVRDRSGVVVGRSDSFDDLLAFWNLRAAGNNVVFLPVDQPHRCEEYARRHIAHLDTLPDVHPAIMNHVTVTHTGEEAYALEFIRDLPAGKPRALARYDDVVWNGLNEKPLRCFFDHRTALGTVANETERPRVHFTLPEKTFLRDTSGRARYQKLALSVDPYTESVYHGHTLRLPFIPELNDKWGNELVIDSARFRVEPEGCCIIIDADQQTQSLAPASFDRVIDAVFGYAGMKVQKSQAGLLATRVLEAMGGIEACRVFQIGSVRKLIKGLDRASVTQRGEATKIIHDEGRFSRHRRLYIESR